MQKEVFSPDSVTFTSILRACANICVISKGKYIHYDIKKRCLEEDVVISTALMAMYGKCGEVEKAKEVFGKLTIHDLTCWTTLISGYAHQKLGEGMLINICGRDSSYKGQKS